MFSQQDLSDRLWCTSNVSCYSPRFYVPSSGQCSAPLWGPTWTALIYFNLFQFISIYLTHLLLTREPPHQTVLPPLLTRPTCQGYSLTSVFTPPTILVVLEASPQLQSQLWPEEYGSGQHFLEGRANDAEKKFLVNLKMKKVGVNVMKETLGLSYLSTPVYKESVSWWSGVCNSNFLFVIRFILMTNMICGVFGPFMRLVMTSIQHSIQSINRIQFNGRELHYSTHRSLLGQLSWKVYTKV